MEERFAFKASRVAPFPDRFRGQGLRRGGPFSAARRIRPALGQGARSRALGYWQEMEKTAETFRGEWVVTGDLLVEEADGYFSYCGRTDDVLKVGGRWLVPAEVEACLIRHPAVAECAVVGMANEEGLVKPRAFVIARDPGKRGPGLEEELKAFVLQELAPISTRGRSSSSTTCRGHIWGRWIGGSSRASAPGSTPRRSSPRRPTRHPVTPPVDNRYSEAYTYAKLKEKT